MTKKYIEVILAIDDTAPNIVEVSSRQKEDDGEWSIPAESSDFVPSFSLNFPWLHLEVIRI